MNSILALIKLLFIFIEKYSMTSFVSICFIIFIKIDIISLEIAKLSFAAALLLIKKASIK